MTKFSKILYFGGDFVFRCLIGDNAERKYIEINVFLLNLLLIYTFSEKHTLFGTVGHHVYKFKFRVPPKCEGVLF